MLANREEVLQAALELSEFERLEIAARLLETVPNEGVVQGLDDAELAAELERRSGDWEGAVSWDDLCREFDGDDR